MGSRSSFVIVVVVLVVLVLLLEKGSADLIKGQLCQFVWMKAYSLQCYHAMKREEVHETNGMKMQNKKSM